MSRRRSRFRLVVALLWFRAFLGTMTDRNRVTAILNSIMNAATATSAMVFPTSWKLRLMSANGSSTANGTELTTANGYTALGATMAAWASISGTTALTTGPSVAVSWTATGAGFTTAGIEIWDIAGTPLRWFWGALSGGAVTVNAGNTLQFAIGSISLDGTGW